MSVLAALKAPLRQKWAAALALSFCALIAGASGGALGAEEPDDAAALIENLRHDEFDVRQAANEKLSALGEAARPALERAITSQDPEIREAVRRLLSKLEKATVLVLAFDRDGQPAADARADLTPYWQGQQGAQPPQVISIGAEGRSAPLGPLSTGSINLQFNWKKWLPAREQVYARSLDLRSGPNPLLAILTRGGTVTAKLLDAEGRPINEGQLALYPDSVFDPEMLDLQLTTVEQWRQQNFSAVCDAEGKARIETVPDGVYQCVARSNAYLPVLLPYVRVREGETLELPVPALKTRVKGKLQFILQRTDGTPLKKAKVTPALEPVFEGERAAEKLRQFRRLRQQIEMRGVMGSSFESDENGKVSLEDLDCGKYRLTVRLDSQDAAQRSGGEAPQDFGEVVVKRELPAETPTFKFAPGGSLHGRIVTTGGAGVRYANISVMPQDELDDQSRANGRFYPNGYFRGSYANSQQDGSYEVKNLAPGKYAVYIYAPTGQIFWIYGLEVAQGQVANAPEAIVPDRPTAQATPIKGTVALPDGTPAGGAQVCVIAGGYGLIQTVQSDEKGAFSVNHSGNVQDDLVPTRLLIKLRRCKPGVVDLTDKNLDPTAIAVRLEKQDYGDLRVKVVDEKGSPLSNVAVQAQTNSTPNYYYGYTQYKPAKTDDNGLARLTGLATGTRVLRLERDGFFVPEEAKATVAAEIENEVTVTMRRGFALTGRLELPAGYPHRNALVAVSGRQRFYSIQEDGTFTLDGLAPGKYKIIALAPGLIQAAEAPVTVDPKRPGPLAVKLKLVRVGGAACNLGADFTGWSAALTPKDGLMAPTGEAPPVFSSTLVDKAGRLEFWGVAPGFYHVLLWPSADFSGGRPQGIHAVTACLATSPIEVKSLKQVVELAGLPADELKCAAATGAVSGRLALEPRRVGVQRNSGNIGLRLVSAQAAGTIHFSFPSDFNTQGASAPIVLGAPPPGVQSAEPGVFCFKSLPAGDYKLYATTSIYQQRIVQKGFGSYTVTDTPPAQPPSTLLASFALKPDENLDLGAVKYALPKEALAPVQADEQSQLEPDDLVPVFQP